MTYTITQAFDRIVSDAIVAGFTAEQVTRPTGAGPNFARLRDSDGRGTLVLRVSGHTFPELTADITLFAPDDDPVPSRIFLFRSTGADTLVDLVADIRRAINTHHTRQGA